MGATYYQHKKAPRAITLALKSQLVLLRLAEHAVCVYN
jgi:hypothetical protein